jgi:hypothetical protein
MDIGFMGIDGFNPLALPWYIGYLMPLSFQRGHPPAFILYTPLVWLVIGVVIAFVQYTLFKLLKRK